MNPPNRGKHYSDLQIEHAVQTWYGHDKDVSKTARQAMAAAWGRSLGAIDWLFRQIEEGAVIGSNPDKARNRMQEQIVRAKRRYMENQAEEITERAEQSELVLENGIEIINRAIEEEVERRVKERVCELVKERDAILSSLDKVGELVGQTVEYWRSKRS